MPTVEIVIDRQQRSLDPGVMRGRDIINLAGTAEKQHLLLDVPDGRGIPLSEDDVLYIQGGEKFSVGTGSSAADENPPGPASIAIDEKPHNLARAKLSGAELKALAGVDGVDLWAELDRGRDELVNDSDLILVQPGSRFFTAPNEQGDRFYEVTVILDGEDVPRRFPAAMTVMNAIRRSLPPRDRAQVGDFDMVDADLGTAPLAPDLTLKAAGVRDGHVLSITKKNGGGG